MQEHKDEPKILEELLVKCAAASSQMNNCRQTVIFLNNLIKNHYGRNDTPDNIVKMIECLRNIGKTDIHLKKLGITFLSYLTVKWRKLPWE